MRYTVTWDHLVIGQIAEEWSRTADQAGFTSGVDDLEDRLRRVPDRTGFPAEEANPPPRAILDVVLRMNRRPGDIRVASVGRFRFIFSVYDDDRTVVVWTVYEWFDEP